MIVRLVIFMLKDSSLGLVAFDMVCIGLTMGLRSFQTNVKVGNDSTSSLSYQSGAWLFHNRVSVLDLIFNGLSFNLLMDFHGK